MTVPTYLEKVGAGRLKPRAWSAAQIGEGHRLSDIAAEGRPLSGAEAAYLVLHYAYCARLALECFRFDDYAACCVAYQIFYRLWARGGGRVTDIG